MVIALLSGRPIWESLVASTLAVAWTLFFVAGRAAKKHLAKQESAGVKLDDADTVLPTHSSGSN
jgi:hypothetical protein